MTADQRLTITISALGLLFLVMSAGIGLLVRLTVRWTKIEDSLKVIAEKIGEIVQNGKDADKALADRIDRNEVRIERHEEWHRDHS